MPDVSQSPLDTSLLQKQILLAFSPAAGAAGSLCWSLPAIVRQEFPRQSVAVPFRNRGDNGFCTRYICVNALLCLSVQLFVQVLGGTEERLQSSPDVKLGFTFIFHDF